MAIAVLTTAALASPAGAATAPSIVGADHLAASPDYATETFGDPWDMAGPSDLLLDDGGPAMGLVGPRFADGRLTFDTGPSGFTVNPVWIEYTGALAVGRDGPAHPVDASRYTRMSIRMYASARVPAAVQWFRCREFTNDCLGGHRFTAEPGWHTYDLPMVNEFPGLPQEWAGNVLGVRVSVNLGDGHAAIDWMRLYRPTAPVTVDPHGGRALFWDRNTNRADNTPDNPGWGPLTGTTFPAGAYPPGTYYIGSDTGYSSALTITAPPQPVIDDPDAAGGDDYATVTTGDAWDFSQPSDAARVVHVTDLSWSGGQLHATNGGTAPNDPLVELRMGPLVDPARYHRLTVRMTYDGPFGLADAPGGGTHGRLLWRRADRGIEWQNSAEIVTWTDRDTYTVDLARPASEVAESGPGWLGSGITALRWDPNEDRGPRRWHLDDIRLAADDATRGGAFDIRWHDDAASPDARVTIEASRDPAGRDRVTIADGLTEQAAGNVFRWRTGGLAPGRWWLHVTVRSANGTGRTHASGPLVVDGVGAVAAAAPSVEEARVAGADRLATAVALSRSAFATAPAVVLVRADDYPDALSAAPLAAAVGGPVLLDTADHLEPRVGDEIVRLGARTVYVAGGVSAQSDAVVRNVAALPGHPRVVRLAGPDRYATAAALAREAVARWRAQGIDSAGDAVLVALGTGFADALAAGPLAAATHQPLLLVAPTAVPSSTRTALADLQARTATIVGGTAAIPASVENALRLPTRRVAGASRYATAIAAARAAIAGGASADHVLVGTGRTYPDALAAAPAAAHLGGILLLTDRDVVLADIRGFLGTLGHAPALLRVAGGFNAVTDPVVATLLAAAGAA